MYLILKLYNYTETWEIRPYLNLGPPNIECPSLVFTHVEAYIILIGPTLSNITAQLNRLA